MDIGIADGMQRVNNVWWVGRGRAKVTGVVSRRIKLCEESSTYVLTYLFTYSMERSPS